MNRKKLYRDTEKCRKARNRSRRNNYVRGNCNFSEGKHEWTVEEIDRVLRHEIPDRELAKELKTSVQAIQVVRWRRKKND